MSITFIGIVFFTALAGLLLGAYFGLVLINSYNEKDERKRRRKVKKLDKKKEKRQIKEDRKKRKNSEKESERIKALISSDADNIENSKDTEDTTMPDTNNELSIKKKKEKSLNLGNPEKHQKSSILSRVKNNPASKRQKTVSLKDRVSDNDSYLSFVCETEGTDETEKIKTDQKSQDNKFLL